MFNIVLNLFCYLSIFLDFSDVFAYLVILLIRSESASSGYPEQRLRHNPELSRPSRRLTSPNENISLTPLIVHCFSACRISLVPLSIRFVYNLYLSFSLYIYILVNFFSAISKTSCDTRGFAFFS